jgi:hypothetical protein
MSIRTADSWPILCVGYLFSSAIMSQKRATHFSQTASPSAPATRLATLWRGSLQKLQWVVSMAGLPALPLAKGHSPFHLLVLTVIAPGRNLSIAREKTTVNRTHNVLIVRR